ncbi:uncharacterized protein LOC126864496 [Bombus huntii]|uniref:uncharacterized protein LOC126864496 n=1 Tax=Bombus huntii TaxID=85661 RepID=UPI0021AA4238|nr:uncharacterized protein LOC126864496 [Bombus huntii]
MANSSEDSSNSNINQTSRMVLLLLTTMQDQMAIMLDLMEMLMQNSSAKPKTLTLPPFNPDIAGANPATWCATVDLLMKDNPLQDLALVFALNDALKGSAGHWFTQMIRNEEFTWPTFRRMFTERSGGQDTATSTLLNIFRQQPQKDENMAEYAIRLRSLLKAKWPDATMDEVINAIILCQVSPQDRRIERVALEKDMKTENEFLSEMRVLAFAERPASSTSNTSTGSDVKRSRPPEPRTKCYHCGNYGHKRAECRKRMKIEEQKNIQSS